jgi:hypothetical protein
MPKRQRRRRTARGSEKRRRCAASARRFGFFRSQSATSLTASGRSIGSQRTPDFRRGHSAHLGPLTAAQSQTGPLSAHSGRLESTFSGRRRPRPWTPQLGGKRAYSGRLGKDRSLDESQHSSASPKWGLPSIETLADVSWTACWAICGPRGLRTQAPRRVQVHGNYGATIVSEETILTASSRHFRRCADRRAWQWGFKRSSPCGSLFKRPRRS